MHAHVSVSERERDRERKRGREMMYTQEAGTLWSQKAVSVCAYVRPDPDPEARASGAVEDQG